MKGLGSASARTLCFCHRIFSSKQRSDAEAFVDISVVCDQLRAGIASGNTRINPAADWTSDCCHGDDTYLSQHHCRASRELYVFSEQANRLIVVHLENE